ncbi:uncharacterized protein L201_001365 [Kwoniella dendrophila CBS 6074]|uniref:Uncharacterized protein n=1 Tax=Kwoniella dendrophila CBS 6074 TaxID=1295534 RepID=A0AAX4JPV3_9TREE
MPLPSLSHYMEDPRLGNRIETIDSSSESKRRIHCDCHRFQIEDLTSHQLHNFPIPDSTLQTIYGDDDSDAIRDWDPDQEPKAQIRKTNDPRISCDSRSKSVAVCEQEYYDLKREASLTNFAKYAVAGLALGVASFGIHSRFSTSSDQQSVSQLDQSLCGASSNQFVPPNTPSLNNQDKGQRYGGPRTAISNDGTTSDDVVVQVDHTKLSAAPN